MAVVELTPENFDKEVVESDIPVIVDFWASWCGPCKMMGPVFDEISDDFKGKLKFCKMSVEDYQDYAQKYEVRGIPCLIIMKKGKEVDRLVGFQGKDKLKADIEEKLGAI